MDLAYYTGRRIKPIRLLTYSDLRLDRTEKKPFGAIHWRAENDKEGNEGTVAIHPERPDEPVPYSLAQQWLLRAVRYAGLRLPPRWGWHSFRRGWATARKHLPAADVAEAGGWLGPHTLEAVYQQADEETTLAVVLSPAHVSDRATGGGRSN